MLDRQIEPKTSKILSVLMVRHDRTMIICGATMFNKLTVRSRLRLSINCYVPARGVVLGMKP